MDKSPIVLFGIVVLMFVLLMNSYKKNVELEQKYTMVMEAIELRDKHTKVLNETLATRDKTIETNSKRLIQIQTQVNTLRESNAELKKILSMVVPDPALTGLRSFNSDSDSTPGDTTAPVQTE